MGFSDNEDLDLSYNDDMNFYDDGDSNFSMNYEQGENYASDMDYDADDEEEIAAVEIRPLTPIDWRKVIADSEHNREMDNCLTCLVKIEPCRRWCYKCLDII